MNGTLIREDVAIRGVRYHKDVPDNFAKGSNQQVRLQWETNNEWDEYAIQVIGTWTDSHGVQHDGDLGYVPAKIAEEIAQTHGDEVSLCATLRDVQDPGFPVPIVCIDIMLS